MSQQFLKSAKVRDFTVWHVAEKTEKEAFEMFIQLRWGDRNHVVCPKCKLVGKHYYRHLRKQWTCKGKDCGKTFSATNDTKFAYRKMSFKKILLGLAEYNTSSNGISNHSLSRRMNVQVKTACAFVGKLREAIYDMRPTTKLSGKVQMDGGYFGGRPRHGRVRRPKKEDIQQHVENVLAKKKVPELVEPEPIGNALKTGE